MLISNLDRHLIDQIKLRLGALDFELRNSGSLDPTRTAIYADFIALPEKLNLVEQDSEVISFISKLNDALDNIGLPQDSTTGVNPTTAKKLTANELLALKSRVVWPIRDLIEHHQITADFNKLSSEPALSFVTSDEIQVQLNKERDHNKKQQFKSLLSRLSNIPPQLNKPSTNDPVQDREQAYSTHASNDNPLDTKFRAIIDKQLKLATLGIELTCNSLLSNQEAKESVELDQLHKALNEKLNERRLTGAQHRQLVKTLNHYRVSTQYHELFGEKGNTQIVTRENLMSAIAKDAKDLNDLYGKRPKRWWNRLSNKAYRNNTKAEKNKLKQDINTIKSRRPILQSMLTTLAHEKLDVLPAVAKLKPTAAPLTETKKSVSIEAHALLLIRELIPELKDDGHEARTAIPNLNAALNRSPLNMREVESTLLNITENDVLDNALRNRCRKAFDVLALYSTTLKLNNIQTLERRTSLISYPELIDLLAELHASEAEHEVIQQVSKILTDLDNADIHSPESILQGSSDTQAITRLLSAQSMRVKKLTQPQAAQKSTTRKVTPKNESQLLQENVNRIAAKSKSDLNELSFLIYEALGDSTSIAEILNGLAEEDEVTFFQELFFNNSQEDVNRFIRIFRDCPIPQRALDFAATLPSEESAMTTYEEEVFDSPLMTALETLPAVPADKEGYAVGEKQYDIFNLPEPGKIQLDVHPVNITVGKTSPPTAGDSIDASLPKRTLMLSEPAKDKEQVDRASVYGKLTLCQPFFAGRNRPNATMVGLLSLKKQGATQNAINTLLSYCGKDDSGAAHLLEGNLHVNLGGPCQLAQPLNSTHQFFIHEDGSFTQVSKSSYASVTRPNDGIEMQVEDYPSSFLDLEYRIHYPADGSAATTTAYANTTQLFAKITDGATLSAIDTTPKSSVSPAPGAR